ncbi:ABC-type Fe3+ transport system [Candidatus Vecturithrix granuli]|uniref:ABC-type Fe3+ transport system n=1 Tax=Vecturithrix granuli TaxID=1499967 RepID=A0A081C9D9_VECG1|nr:ABC-type Fe3+ transport system [Candidatus Vecturithrix granuli]
MFTVSIILVLALLVLIFIVNFVLTNLAMFQTPFDIVISLPFINWAHTWEGVEFMYIIAGSILIGALVIAISTWVLDTRRKLKLRNMRKELKRLEQALQEAKASLPQEDVTQDISTSGEEPSDFVTPTSPSPEEITRSFEDAVQEKDFFQKSRKNLDEKLTSDKSGIEEVGPPESERQQLLHETPIEAELVDVEETEKKTRSRNAEEGKE